MNRHKVVLGIGDSMCGNELLSGGLHFPRAFLVYYIYICSELFYYLMRHNLSLKGFSFCLK